MYTHILLQHRTIKKIKNHSCSASNLPTTHRPTTLYSPQVPGNRCPRGWSWLSPALTVYWLTEMMNGHYTNLIKRYIAKVATDFLNNSQNSKGSDVWGWCFIHRESCLVKSPQTTRLHSTLQLSLTGLDIFGRPILTCCWVKPPHRVFHCQVRLPCQYLKLLAIQCTVFCSLSSHGNPMTFLYLGASMPCIVNLEKINFQNVKHAF